MNAVLHGIESLPAETSALLGLPMQTEAELWEQVIIGLPIDAFHTLTRHVPAIPKNLVAPESTMRRRLAGSAAFSREESERVVRIARTFALASMTFGDEARALNWFTHPTRFLPDHEPASPMQLCETEAGGRLVEERLRRSQYGFF